MPKRVARNAALALFSAVLSLSAAPALAGTVTLQSMQFSAGKPVPHLHYEGEVIEGDLERIAAAVSQYVDCDPKTLPDTGGNCAVITMTSEGGNYVEGLRIAHFFRENAIATWVKTGSYCYSACAFAFLGGSGHSSWPATGDYIDRTIEPGGTLGFHAPYVVADSLGELVAQYGVQEVLGASRENIALMIDQLVYWNVDDGVLSRITNMGADEAYTASTAQDLYLLRTALPDAPRRLWAPDPAEALRNACMRLLAHHEDVWPYDVRDRLAGEIAYNIGTDDRGWALSGYELTGNPGGLTVSYCAVHTTDAHLGANADIALYYGPGVEGHMRPALTFFHRPEGWSTLGTGGTAAQRIFQKGGIGHFFLPPEAELGGAHALTWRLVGEDFLKTGQFGQ
ncbi:hypothetical protein AB2N04_14040 [Nitratireductor sp. GISD-1A_MAKvit]|uniref:hypothetical protein n=1 Tax=Nitratireductor sp. GISD-1A_MAKvit TaxID=3234198 RepID=UPI00346722BC